MNDAAQAASAAATPPSGFASGLADSRPDGLLGWIGAQGSGWSGLLELGLAAVLLFWVVGAYNRLARLRAAIGAAWAQIDELLGRRSAVLGPLIAALQEPLLDEAATLAALQTADARQREAAQAVRARPAQPAALMAWVLAEAALASPLARLQALVEQRAELHEHDELRPLLRQLAELAQRQAYARTLFSDAAAAYSQALAEFPTRIVARLFGLRPVPGL